MPISVRSTGNGGTFYGDVRVGDKQTIHQVTLDVAALAGAADADGYLPPGLPLKADGTPVGTGESAVCVLGPESVKLADVDVFANAIYSGGLNRAAIESNLGRALSADEATSLSAAPFILFG